MSNNIIRHSLFIQSSVSAPFAEHDRQCLRLDTHEFWS